jgi:hypothetical protein
MCDKKKTPDSDRNRGSRVFFGVSDGGRTRGLQDHNLAL